MLALLVGVFLPSACAPPESNGITNSPPSPLKSPPKLPKQVTGRAFNGNTITYYTIDTTARAALTPQSIGITDISGDIEYTIEQVGTSGQVGYIADTSAIQPSKANPNTLDIPQGTTGFFTVQVKVKNAKRDAAMPSKKVLIAAGSIDVGAKLAMPDTPTLGTPAPKKENITVNAATKKVRITVLEAGTTFTVVPPPQFPAEAPKYTLTYSAEGIGDNNIVKAIDQATGELTQGDVGNGDDIAAIKARTADIAVKVTAEAVGPYPALQDTTVFTVVHYRWMRVASGKNHRLAINSRGELYAWGRNDEGQLGIGTTTDNELAPQRVGSDSDWAAVSGGEDHSLALKSDGTLYAWGKNHRGQLGIGSTDNENAPQQVGNADDWKAIAAGNKHSLALKSDSTLYAWGANYIGQLGNGENGADFNDKSKDKTAPIQIGTDRDWKTISAGSTNSRALKIDNTIHTWGYNGVGQLGMGDAIDRNSPTKVGSDTDWKAVSVGEVSSFVLKENGTLYAMGVSELLGIGTDTPQTRKSPTPVPHP